MNTNPVPLDHFGLWDAAYVLGSLSPAERREYEGHLAGCDRCRERIAGLAGLPGLLGLANPAVLDPSAATPPPAPYAVFARKARRRRAGIAAAAAAAVLALVGGTAAATLALHAAPAPPAAQGSTQTGAKAVPLSFVSNGQDLLSASGQVRPEAWGTRIDWTCNYRAGAGYGTDGETSEYELVVVTTAGGRVTVATWQAAPGSSVAPTATTTIPVAAMREMIIAERDGAGPATPLLTAKLQ